MRKEGPKKRKPAGPAGNQKNKGKNTMTQSLGEVNKKFPLSLCHARRCAQ